MAFYYCDVEMSALTAVVGWQSDVNFTLYAHGS